MPVKGMVYKSRVARRLARTVVRDGDVVVKTFRRLGFRPLLRPPWNREHRCLVRLRAQGVPAPRPLGLDRPGRGLVQLRRTFVEGRSPAELDSRLARLLALRLQEIHAAGVTTGDLSLDNLLVTPGGKLLCIDFGRGSVFRIRGASYCFAVGKELARARRLFAESPASWSSFAAEYDHGDDRSRFRRRLVRALEGYWSWRWSARDARRSRQLVRRESSWLRAFRGLAAAAVATLLASSCEARAIDLDDDGESGAIGEHL
jgi:hypothetical protein